MSEWPSGDGKSAADAVVSLHKADGGEASFPLGVYTIPGTLGVWTIARLS
jgi:hypothetical protein